MIGRFLSVSFVATTLLVAGCDRKPDVVTYEKELFVPGAPFHGLHGLTFGSDGTLYAGSVVGQAIYAVNTETGDVSEYVGPIAGQADDLEFNQTGGLAWTAILQGKVYYKPPMGEIRVLAEGLLGANSLAFNNEGRLFMTTVFLGDALYEVHLSGKTPPRLIMEGMGGLNGFDFGPDGKLYGPLWFKGQVARIDVDEGTLEVVTEGLTVPAAVNFNSKGELFVIDNETGEIFRVDTESGERTLVTTAPTNLDNLAFDKDDNLYVSNMSDSAVYAVDVETGALHTVVSGPLSVPTGLAVHGDTLYVADTFNFSKVDLDTGAVGDIARTISEHEYPTGVSVTDEAILVASANSGMVQRFDTTTEERLSRWTGFTFTIKAIDLGEEIAVLEGIGKITMVSGEDGSARRTLNEDLVDPAGMDFYQGALYVSEASLGQISKIDITTGEKSVVVEGLSQPEGLALDPQGTLFVAEVGKDQVTEIKPDGATRAIATEIPMGLVGVPLFPPAYMPSGLTLSEDGTLYVSSDIENSIYRLTPKK